LYLLGYEISCTKKSDGFLGGGMFIAYYDESGDDGLPPYSSPLFVLSAIYLHHQNWKSTFESIREFRKKVKNDFGVPVNMEFHCKYFLLNKNPYRTISISDDDRILLIDLFCGLIGLLDIKIVNIVINKKKITKRPYDILDRALTYSIQRIENDLNKMDPSKKFIIITDEGRVGKMRRTSRKIQKINFIPSKYDFKQYRREIKALIEDPLPKDSKESYFIQLADLVAYIVYMYSLLELGIGHLPNRMPDKVTGEKINEWMKLMMPSLNLEASASHPYGVVCYPK
jgi:hypothetical protein